MSRLTVSGDGKNGWSINGTPGYQFKNKNGVAGFMLPGNESSWVPATGEPIKNLKGLDNDNSRLTDDPKVINKDPFAPTSLPTVSTRDNPAPDGGNGSGTQTSPGGGRPIMSMTDADALYKLNGLGSYSSGAKGYTSTDSSDPVYAKTKNYTEIKPSNPLYAEAFGQDLADSQLNGNTANMSMSDALADTESMRGPETDEGRLMRARAAFLDTDGSYEGLRAQERELDIIYAGGQHYALGDDGAFIKNSAGLNQAADPEQVKELKSGQLYKDAFTQNLINSTAETPSQAENPFVQSPLPVAFNTEALSDFGSTELLGNDMDMIAGNAFNKSDISPLNEGAFTQDLDVSQYIPGYPREPYMRQLK